MAKGPEADLLRKFVELLYFRDEEADSEPLSSQKQESSEEGREELRQSSSAAELEYQSITPGDRAYQSPELTKKLFRQYPFIKTFLRDNDYLKVREFTVFISHSKTGL